MRRVLPCVLLLAIISLPVYLTGCSGRQPGMPAKKAAAVNPTPKPADQGSLKASFQGARIAWDDANGMRLMEAEFKEAIASQSGTSASVELRGVKASLFKDGKVASTLIAPTMTANSSAREILATGGVQILSPSQHATARSDELVWKSRENKVLGTGAVKMTVGNISITARRFEADTALKKARFTGAEASLR